jgi:hypothetical protein
MSETEIYRYMDDGKIVTSPSVHAAGNKHNNKYTASGPSMHNVSNQNTRKFTSRWDGYMVLYECRVMIFIS